MNTRDNINIARDQLHTVAQCLKSVSLDYQMDITTEDTLHSHTHAKLRLLENHLRQLTKYVKDIKKGL